MHLATTLYGMYKIL